MTTVEYELAAGALYAERHGIGLAFPPRSPLAELLLAALDDPTFREAVLAHLAAGRATGRGRCELLAMQFLNVATGCAVLPHWSRQPSGAWHAWVQVGSETFEAVEHAGRPLLLVLKVDEFRRVRGLEESDER